MYIKKYLLLTVFFFFSNLSQAQVNINSNTAPHQSAALEVTAGTPAKGLLPPRISLTSDTDITTIANPATGLLVYNTNAALPFGTGLYQYNGTQWQHLAVTSPAQQASGQFLRAAFTASPTTIAANNTGNIVINTVSMINNITNSTPTSNQVILPKGTYRVDVSIAGGWSSSPPPINSGQVEIVLDSTTYATHLFTGGATLSDIFSISNPTGIIQFRIRAFSSGSFTLDASNGRAVLIITKLN